MYRYASDISGNTSQRRLPLPETHSRNAQNSAIAKTESRREAAKGRDWSASFPAFEIQMPRAVATPTTPEFESCRVRIGLLIQKFRPLATIKSDAGYLHADDELNGAADGMTAHRRYTSPGEGQNVIPGPRYRELMKPTPTL